MLTVLRSKLFIISFLFVTIASASFIIFTSLSITSNETPIYSSEPFLKEEGKVYYLGGSSGRIELTNADFNSFKYLNGLYSKDKERIFCCQYECKEINSQSIEKFTVFGISNYARDADMIYKDCKVLPGVDKYTFKPINVNYYKDSMGIYYNGLKVTDSYGAMPRTLGETTLAAGGKIYFENRVVPEAQFGTYKVIDNIYAKDAKSVFALGVRIPGADSTTFKKISSGFGKDVHFVYSIGEKIAGADPLSFQTVDNFYQKDDKYVYYQGARIPGADSLSFITLGNGQAKDKNNLYIHGKPVNAPDDTSGGTSIFE